MLEETDSRSPSNDWSRLCKADKDELVFSFACRVTGGQLSLTDEADACQYFDLGDIPPNTSPKQVARIHDALDASAPPVFRRQAGPSTREMLQHYKSH